MYTGEDGNFIRSLRVLHLLILQEINARCVSNNLNLIAFEYKYEKLIRKLRTVQWNLKHITVLKLIEKSAIDKD